MDLVALGREVPNGGTEKARRKMVEDSVADYQRQRQRQEEESLVSSPLTKQLDPLETVTERGTTDETSHPTHPPEKAQATNSDCRDADAELAAIAKDLSKIKRQNTVTHVLLGTVIVMTAVWQVNEVSFLLWVQRKLSNPFKALADLVKGALGLTGRSRLAAVVESAPLPPPVGTPPDGARAELPTLVIGGDHR